MSDKLDYMIDYINSQPPPKMEPFTIGSQNSAFESRQIKVQRKHAFRFLKDLFKLRGRLVSGKED
jgi:hypothetical protein